MVQSSCGTWFDCFVAESLLTGYEPACKYLSRDQSVHPSTRLTPMTKLTFTTFAFIHQWLSFVSRFSALYHHVIHFHVLECRFEETQCIRLLSVAGSSPQFGSYPLVPVLNQPDWWVTSIAWSCPGRCAYCTWHWRREYSRLVLHRTTLLQ